MDFAGKNSPEKSRLQSDFPPSIKQIFDVNSIGQDKVPNFPEVGDFGRESLGIINLESLDVGRESLGISNIRSSDCVGLSLPEVQITDLTQNSNSILNYAFLLSNEDISDAFSGSSCNSVYPSFHSTSLDSNIPSTISPTSSYKSDVLNDVFINSSDFFQRLQMYGKPLKSFLRVRNIHESHHLRIKSLPSTLEGVRHGVSDEGVFKDCKLRPLGKSEEMLRKNTSGDECFGDSVFIEANHLAARIENGSILELGERENDMLELIQEPENLMQLSNGEVQSNEIEGTHQIMEEIVDQVDPPPLAAEPVDGNNSMNDANVLNNTDPKDLLHTLSGILNKDNVISKKQKSDCQKIISNMVEILSSNLNDSGHSSVDNEPDEDHQEVEIYEVLDLSKRNNLDDSINNPESNDNYGPLDLSLKSKSANSENSFVTPKFFASKFNSSQLNRSLIKENKSLRNSNSSISSNESKSFNEVTSKFRLKKVEDKQTVKKGPLKATLPMKSVTKKKNEESKLLRTPNRNELQLKIKMGKTSTPDNNTLLKPVAQSTPEYSNTASPVNKPTGSSNNCLKNMKQKLNYSASNNSSVTKSQHVNKPSSLIRRRSVDDMKKNQDSSKKFNRSYSVGENSQLTATASSVKERINKSTSSCVRQNKSTIGFKEYTKKTVNTSSLARKKN